MSIRWTWPFDGPVYRMAMGLRALNPADWLIRDPWQVAQMPERRRLVQEEAAAVLACLPEGATAVAELMAKVQQWLRHYAPHDATDGSEISDAAPLPLLATLGSLAAEDFCILLPSPAGWRLVGAVLCFPNRWRLAEKLGRNLPGIHDPVPDFEATLANPVERFFDRLAVGRGVWRANWSVNDDPALFQPRETAHLSPDMTITEDNAGHRLYLRIERQTVTKLPETGAVIFTIRTEQRCLNALDRKDCVQLAGVLRGLPPAMALYKGLARTGGPALRFLERRLAVDHLKA